MMTLALPIVTTKSVMMTFAFELLPCLHQLLQNLLSSSIRVCISARSPFHKEGRIEDMKTAQVMSMCALRSMRHKLMLLTVVSFLDPCCLSAGCVRRSTAPAGNQIPGGRIRFQMPDRGCWCEQDRCARTGWAVLALLMMMTSAARKLTQPG